jgi:methyl-accepting chemotaxis protein
MLGGRQVIRVAVSDRMVAEACVACHKTRADSPKTGWKVGDVRGVLEVVADLDEALAAGRNLTWTIMIGIFLGGLLLSASSVLAARSVVSPVRTIVGAMRKLAGGDDQFALPKSSSRNEVGEMWGALRELRISVREAFRLGQMVENSSGALPFF